MPYPLVKNVFSLNNGIEVADTWPRVGSGTAVASAQSRSALLDPAHRTFRHQVSVVATNGRIAQRTAVAGEKTSRRLAPPPAQHPRDIVVSWQVPIAGT